MQHPDPGPGASPLRGRRVLLTRAEHQIAPAAELLRARGAEPVPFPTIALRAPPDPGRVERAVRELGGYDLVVLTSKNGVDWLWREIERHGHDARAFGRALVAAIGPATAAALERHGVQAGIVAAEFVAEQLARDILDKLGERARGARALLARALVAREVLPQTLRQAGIAVDVVPVYQTVMASKERAAELRAMFEQGSIDAVLLTASSTAEGLCALLGEDAPQLLAATIVASIGPVTTATAERLGVRVDLTGARHTIEGLIQALEEHVVASRREPAPAGTLARSKR
ncbi:MAG: uroporphyrinogen-III synthase [Deltaproteobacteria bacterium]|nr:uroporphyrinogen-III synthase [Deltaproteobacteria bacterium]